MGIILIYNILVDLCLNLLFTYCSCNNIGSMTNKSEAINKCRPLAINESECRIGDWSTNDKWYIDGCYRKHGKSNFRASKSLTADLEFLF